MMRKMSEICYADDEKELSIVKIQERAEWFVINDSSALIYGPDNFANCSKFVEQYE